jgi:hypothetical protein
MDLEDVRNENARAYDTDVQIVSVANHGPNIIQLRVLSILPKIRTQCPVLYAK